mgnify:CR=1 FL=1
MKEHLRIALPSKGSLGQTSLDFLYGCGFIVKRGSDRQYTGTIQGYDIEVLFQRAEDIPPKVWDGTTHLGITGLDLVEEHKIRNGSTQILFPHLGYGKANLVVAVPESWIHVSSVYDLADLVAKWQLTSQGKHLRIATKFKALTERFLHENNIYNYQLVEVSGVLEVTPKLNQADIIVDLTSSGVTLKENHLKVVDGGTLLKSEACLIGNRSIFSNPCKTIQPLVEQVIDKIESHIRARDYVRVMTNIECTDSQQIEREIKNTLAKESIQIETFTLSQSLFPSRAGDSVVNINLIVPTHDLYRVVQCLRQYNALEIASTKIDYLFLNQSRYYQQVYDRIQKEEDSL